MRFTMAIAACVLFISFLNTVGGTSLPVKALPLKVVADVPLPGGATRMDYLSVDPASHRVYLAHMGDGSVVCVDTARRKVLATVEGLPRVRGVLAVPELGRVYAAAAGTGEIVALDAGSLKPLGRIRAGNVDGLDYAPSVRRLFVTDQHGGNDVVIDASAFKVEKTIPVGGDVGNTRFDPVTGRVLVAVGATDELVAIDPRGLEIVGRHALPGVKGAHGIALDPSTGTAYIAGEGNATVCAFSLREGRVTSTATVGDDPDVLDVDTSAHVLYVASESGVVSVFDVSGGGLKKLAEGPFVPGAHVVGVDTSTHLLYFPLEDVGGRPTLRIVRYAVP